MKGKWLDYFQPNQHEHKMRGGASDAEYFFRSQNQDPVIRTAFVGVVCHMIRISTAVHASSDDTAPNRGGLIDNYQHGGGWITRKEDIYLVDAVIKMVDMFVKKYINKPLGLSVEEDPCLAGIGILPAGLLVHAPGHQNTSSLHPLISHR